MDLDRKTIVAVALCVLFLILYRPLLHTFGLDKYLAPAPARQSATAPARTDTLAAVTSPGAGSTLGAAAGPAATPPGEATVGAVSGTARRSASLFATPAHPAAQLEQTFVLETPLYRATFTNRGARLLAVELKRYASANGVSSRRGRPVRVRGGQDVQAGDRVSLAGGPLFGLDLGAGEAQRDLSGVAYVARDSVDAAGRRVALTFEARDSSGAYVRQTYRVRPDTYALDLDVEIRGVPVGWRLAEYSLTVRSWPLVTETDERADARSLRSTSMVGTSLHREHVAQLVGRPRSFDGSALWAAVQSRYFVAGVALAQGGAGRSVTSGGSRRPLDPGDQAAMPAGSPAEMEVATNTLVVGLPSELRPTQRFVLYAGPSDYFRLASLRLGIERVVDLGWAWVQPASRALLALMRWLYLVVRNYGVAIILLATLVRLLLHPLNVAGIRNMRAMQRIQPELERIKDKYKNDPQALNTAMMALYRENKVNPAGGCLPMLVQIPVFVALYTVLFNAIELRQAPFVAWIHDLSAPDLLFNLFAHPVPLLHEGPVRLLPLLMLGSGLLSQRLTPSDPRQLPTMYLMNAFMTVFFYNLPSGLVLYWTLMNVLTAFQQWLVLRHDGAHPPVVAVAAPAQSKSRKR